jgi:hypothetical protein
MAVASVTTKPQVVHMGGATEERYTYTAGGVDTIYKGDLIRINALGTIDVAEAASAGAVHGIALGANAASAVVIPILKFAADTIIKIQTIDGEAPSDLVIGDAYTLEVSTANVQAITATNGATGVALVTAYAGTGQPWEDISGTYDETSTTDNNSVLVRIPSAVLDAVVTEAS